MYRMGITRLSDNCGGFDDRKMMRITIKLLDKGIPMINRHLVEPWRLASLGVGLLLLIAGSIYLPSTDWDIPICLIMGIPAYVFAPWAFRQVYYFRLKWLPVAVLAFWLSVDGLYWLYWGIKDPELVEVFRWANFVYSTPIFWLSGFIWNLTGCSDSRISKRHG